MKKITTIIIALSLCAFVGGTLPVYAATTSAKKTTTKSKSSTSKKTVKKVVKKKVATLPSVASLEKVFYYIPGAASFASLQMYQDSIKILAPQSYTIDIEGNLSGGIHEKVQEIVRAKNIQVLPLVSNKNFSQGLMTTILASSDLQNKVIDQLVTEAKAKNYIGWQFDFERMAATDRENYSLFVERAAQKFRENNLHLSVAVITRTSENPTDLPEGSWDNWAGVYDYTRIGKAADSVVLMAYDMPASTGPVADIRWVKQVIEYAIKFIPKEKISLGIPAYGWIWDHQLNAKVKSAGDGKTQELLVNNLYTEKGYDTTVQSGWIRYTEDGVPHTLWYENTQSFIAKVRLVQQYQLKGFSLWAIGLEDDAIWNHMK